MKIVITSANSATGSMLIPVLKAVVHLSGELNAKRAAFYEEANLETARVVAAHARAVRLIYLSYPHASSGEKIIIYGPRDRPRRCCIRREFRW
jgi:hypothetical protein